MTDTTRYRLTFAGPDLGFFPDVSIVIGKSAADKDIGTYALYGYTLVKIETRYDFMGEWINITKGSN